MTRPDDWRLQRLALTALLVCTVAGAGFARGDEETEMGLDETHIDWDTLAIGAELTVTGELAVYGNEPHTYLAVAVEDPESPSGIRLVQVEGELLEELYELQGQTVTVIGTVSRTEIGPGFPTLMDVEEFRVQEDS